MRSGAIVYHSDFDHPWSTMLNCLYHGSLNSVENYKIIKCFSSSLESGPMEEVIATIVPRYKAESFFELPNLASHQREFLVVFEGYIAHLKI